MSATEGSSGGRRRVLLIATPFAVGAVAGAGVLAGLGMTGSSDSTQPTAAPAASPATTNVVQTTSQFDA